MVSVLPKLLTNLDSILASLTVLFPGFLAYFIYVGLRAVGFERIKRSHVVLILFFTLFFQILKDLSGGLMQNGVYRVLFFFLFPVVLGVVSDIAHRLFMTVVVKNYQEYVVDSSEFLGLIDVGNVSRWQKTVRDYVEAGLNDITKEYYVEVELLNPGEGTEVKRGFLNGYSQDDIELIRYDDLSEKDFTGIGTPDLDEGQLTMNVELVPREKISSVRIYRVKMEDFELE